MISPESKELGAILDLSTLKQEYLKTKSQALSNYLLVNKYTYKSSLQVNRQIDDYRWKLSIRRALDGSEFTHC